MNSRRGSLYSRRMLKLMVKHGGKVLIGGAITSQPIFTWLSNMALQALMSNKNVKKISECYFDVLGKMFNFILVLELFYVVTTTTYDFFRHFLIFLGTYINISSCCNFFKHLVWDTNRKTHFYSLFTWPLVSNHSLYYM